MFSFEQFWEYTNQRIRYDENIQYLEEMSKFSLSDLKQYPPQQCALPTTPILRPQTLHRQYERRNVLRHYTSPARLRLSKTKQRDYMESLSKWAHKKYKKFTQRKKYEHEEKWDSESSISSSDISEWETDPDYDDQEIDDIEIPKLNLLSESDVSPIPKHQRIISHAHSPPPKQTTPLLFKGVVSEVMKGPNKYYDSISKYETKIDDATGKRLRKKKPDPKKGIKWKGDEAKRLKVCISALMQMRFHDQLAYSGLLSSITLYMRTTLEMTSSSAAMAISIWTGLCYLTPLLSAYCADAKWGRAKTLVIAQYIFFVGMFLIAISTYFGVAYYDATHGLFWLGMVIVGIGFGGFKPTLSPLGADQFDAKHKSSEHDKQVAKQKRSSFFGWLYWANQVGAIFASSVIAYICQNINFSIGWSLACIALIFAIASYYSAKNYFICVPPEGSIFGNFLKVTCISCDARCRGKKKPPVRASSIAQSLSTNPVTPPTAHPSPFKLRTMQSPIAAIKEENESMPLNVDVDMTVMTPNKNSDKNSDNIQQDTPNTPASPTGEVPRLGSIVSYYGPPKPSMLDWAKTCNGGKFDDHFVEEIKTAISCLPALIPFPVAYIIYTNLLTLVYSQGCQMNVNMGSGFVFPISSLSLISTATIILFVPLTEKWLYPAMNKWSEPYDSKWHCLKVTPLKKMALAFTVAIIAMLISGITEIIRKKYVYIFPLSEMDSPCGSGLPVSDMSILWQSPQFFLLGMSRVLINTGAQDFFYTESPKSMKSTLFSLNYAVDGFGAVMGSVSIIIVNSGSSPWITNNLNDGHLEYYFFVIGAIMCVLFAFFLVFAKSYTYKEIKRIKYGKHYKKLRGKS